MIQGQLAAQIGGDGLRRSLVGFAAQFKSGTFQFSLEVHARQRACAEIRGVHGDHHRRVGVDAVAGKVAHAVGDDGVFLGGGRHYHAAGAHTEGVNSAAVHAMGQLIFALRQGRMSCVVAVQSLVDESLRVLDTHAHGEGFRLHEDLLAVEHFEGVSCAVTDGKDQLLTGQLALGGLHAADSAVFPQDLGHLHAEAHLAAQFDDLLADGFYHMAQLVGANVRLLLIADLLRCAVADQLFQNVAAAGVADTGGQLAVGESACAALAKLYVGPGAEDFVVPEVLHGFHAGIHIGAALQNDGLIAQSCQHQRREHSRRSETNHHRTMLQCAAARFKGNALLLLQLHILAVCLFHQSFLVALHHDGHGADDVDIALFAGIHGAFHQIHGFDLFRLQLCCASCRLEDALPILIQTGFYIGNDDRHSSSFLYTRIGIESLLRFS